MDYAPKIINPAKNPDDTDDLSSREGDYAEDDVTSAIDNRTTRLDNLDLPFKTFKVRKEKFEIQTG